MELKKYILPLLEWWWLLLTAAIVAAVLSFVATLQQPPIYQTKATLMIGRTIEDPNPSANEFWLSQQLAVTYADIAKRDIVRSATMKALGLNKLPPYQALAQPNSQLIDILVTDTNPQRAQLVANELANQLILNSPTSAQSDEQSRREFVNQQLDTLEVQIKETQDQIRSLQGELGSMVSARQITDTQNQIAALQAKLATLQGNYANLLSNTNQGAINTLTLIEPAALPVRPVGPNRGLTVMVAGGIGLILAALAAYLLEYLDNTLKTMEGIKRAAPYPIIGRFFELDEPDQEQLVVSSNPRHPVVEAFRTLRANLEFAAVDQPLNSVLVSSSETGEGKSFVSANLAIALAQAEKKVILVDADMRKPKLHEVMEMSNDLGLSDIFRGRTTIEKALKWRDERVMVITAGASPPNPSELLGSRKMGEILERLKELADVVVIDGPPFIVADAAVLSAKVDGVLLVIRPAYSQESAVKAMLEQISRSGARVVGVALNRIPRRSSDFYAGELYMSPYLDSGDQKRVKKTNGFERRTSRKLLSSINKRVTQGLPGSSENLEATKPRRVG